MPGNNLWRPAVTDRTCWATVLSKGTKSTVTTQRVRVSQRKYCTAQHCCSDSIKYHSYYTTASTTPTKLQPATPSTTPGDNNPPTCQTVTGQWSLASVSLLCSAVLTGLKVQKASEKALAIMKDHIELLIRPRQTTKIRIGPFGTRQKRFEVFRTSN